MTLPRPIWVVGLPGCSVSRVAALLGQHPDARLLPELALFPADTVGALLLIHQRSQDRLGDGLLRAVAELCGPGQTDRGIAQARDWLWRRSDWTIAALLAELCARAAPQRLILPDLQLGWRADYLARFESLPAGPLLHVLRHPASYCRDMTRTLSQHSFVPPDFRDYCNDPVGVIDPQLAWYRFNRNLRGAAFAYQPPIPLRLEELQRRPTATLDALLPRLGLRSADTAAWLQAAADPCIRPGPSAAPGGVERGCQHRPALELELRVPPVWPAQADWRADQRATSAEVGILAAAFGYRQL